MVFGVKEICFHDSFLCLVLQTLVCNFRIYLPKKEKMDGQESLLCFFNVQGGSSKVFSILLETNKCQALANHVSSLNGSKS